MNNKKMLIKSLGVVSCMSLLCCCVALGTNINTKAENVNTNTFTQTKGASVRLSEDNVNGIRFGAQMDETKYNEIMANVENGTYSAVRFGVIIAPAIYETKFGELNEVNLFSKDAKYNWALADENGNWTYTEETGKTRVTNIYSNVMKKDIATNNMVIYGGICDLLEKNIQLDFTSQAYYAYTEGEVTTYVLAEKDTNKDEYVRSMEDVARMAIYDTKEGALTKTQKDALQKMYIEKAQDETKSEDKANITLPQSAKVGETITLTQNTLSSKALNHVAKFTPDYKQGKVVENIKDGEYKVVDSGTLSITYSLPGVKTVTSEIQLDYPTKEGEVFNPEIPKMINNITSWTVDATLEKGDELDKNYKGAYLSMKPKGEWVRLNKITPRQDVAKYNGYNSFSMWVRFTSTSNKVEIHFFNNENRIINANEWVKVYLNKDMFLNSKDNLIPWKNDANWANGKAITEVRVGEIKAEEKVVLNNTIFAVGDDGNYSMGNYAVDAPGTRMNASLKAGDSKDKVYKGGYLSLKPMVQDWVRMKNIVQYQYEHKDNPNPYKEYNNVSMWVRFTSTSPNVQIAFFNNEVRTFAANTWIKLHFDKDTLLKCKDNLIPWNNNINWPNGKAITEVRVGEIIAEKGNVLEASNIMFKVQDDLSYVYGGYAVAGASNIQTSLKAGDKNDANYKGAYLSCVPTKEDWGRIQKITVGKDLAKYNQNTIKLWVYFKSDAKTVPIKFYDNATYQQDIVTNQWVQITLDMAAFKANQNKSFLPFKYVKGWLNITEVRIGEMIAE